MVRLREATQFHDPRGTLEYALVLLCAGDVERARRAIRAVLAMQETHVDDAHYGNFRWLLEDGGVNDLNGVEFMLDDLIPLLREHAAALGNELCAEMRSAIALGLDEINRLDVHPSYTNIVLSDIANSVLGGELLGEPRYVERGARRLDEWLAFTDASGAPHEFNSPTYVAVDIMRMAAVAEHAADRAIAFKARVAEGRLWWHVASHYHPGLAQLGGARSREYFDGWSGASGYLKMLLWPLLGDDALRRPTPYARNDRDETYVPIALSTLHCPDYILRLLRDRPYPFVARETTDVARAVDITTHQTAEYVLGTASRSYAVGAPPEPWNQFGAMQLYFRRREAPGFGSLYVRYVVDDLAPGETGHRGDDHWDTGQHVAAQRGNLAIVAYGLTPRLRPVRSCKLSLRVLGLGQGDGVWVGQRRVGASPAPVAACEPVVIAAGEVCIKLIPLSPSDMAHGAPIELRRSGDGLTLDIYNYKGPPKSFWEHRSQSGPFYKGNVRNAFVIEVASRSEYPDVDAWRRRAAQLRISDAVDDRYRRTITCTTADGSVSMTYSLGDMSLLERRADGGGIVPPMSRAGSSTGAGPQLAISRDSAIDLGRLAVASDASAKWLFADDDARRYVVIHASDAPSPMQLRTPDVDVSCSTLGFGRIDIDERAATVTVETARETGTVRVRSSLALRLTVNGVESPAESL